MQVIGSIFLVFFYCFLYFSFGIFFISIFKINTNSIIRIMIMGFFFYFCCFQFVALPFKIVLSKLSTLSIVWFCILCVIISITYIFYRKKILNIVNNTTKDIKNRYCILVFLLLAIYIVFIELNQDVGSRWDSAYYIGETTSSLFTNTISQYDPYTGEKVARLHYLYFLENYQIHSAVICQLTRLSPLLEIRTTMVSVIIIVNSLVLIEIAKILVGKKYSSIILFLLFNIIINLCYTSGYSASSFLFNRTFEGKTITGNIIIPAILYCFILIKNETKEGWILLFIILLASPCLNMSSMFINPVMLTAYFIPYIMLNKKWKLLINYSVCLIPCFAVLLYYCLASHGYLLIYTK